MEAVQVIDLDKLATDAMKRLKKHINWSAGQHQRAIRKAFLALIKQTKEGK